ncbi:MAG: hypothetical protein U0802_12035 [Candidatus Binatia bacterium]
MIEALIVQLAHDATLRVLEPTGLRLLITTGQMIQIGGSGAYLDGYLQVVDAYPR